MVNINNEAVKYGIINGLIALLIMYGTWAIDINTFVTAQLWGMWFPYMIIILLIGGFALRKSNGGYLSFKEALKFTFLSYVIAGVIVAVGTYVLYNIIDPELTKRSFEAGVEKMRGMMEKFGTPDDKIDEQIEKSREQAKETGIKNILLGFGLGLIWDFVKSLLISLIIRKEKPAFQEDFTQPQ